MTSSATVDVCPLAAAALAPPISLTASNTSTQRTPDCAITSRSNRPSALGPSPSCRIRLPPIPALSTATPAYFLSAASACQIIRPAGVLVGDGAAPVCDRVAQGHHGRCVFLCLHPPHSARTSDRSSLGW